MEDVGGKHCEFDDCNELDFLPFQCPSCRMNLCLKHRSYIMHKCSSGESGGKDATSLDCPICMKSVKFFYGQDVNDIWEKHYTTTCTQKQAKSIINTLCSHISCNIILKDTNKVVCSKCTKLFCLKHRVPEDHDCSSVIARVTKSKGGQDVKQGRLAMLERLTSSTQPSAKTAVQNKKLKQSNTSSSSSSSSIAAKITSADYHSHSQLECPFCNLKGWSSVTDLQGHISRAHDDTSTVNVDVDVDPTSTFTVFTSAPSTTTAAAASSSLGVGSEVCPTCQQRFSDAVALVSHFETAHTTNSPSSTTSTSNNKRKNQCDIN
jgi:predicted nucleic acid binding AN1-type Zn finger protein